MATSKRTLILAVLVLAGAFSSGCQLMSLPFFLLPGMDPKHEPECKLASKDKDKKIKVVILASSGLERNLEFIRVDRDLANLLAASLKTSFTKNKENVEVIPCSRVAKYKDEHPNWRSVGSVEVGKFFQADYVIELEINQMSLYQPGMGNMLYQGRTSISLQCLDVNKTIDNQIFQKEYTTEWPRTKGPIPADDTNPAQFRQQFLNVVAKELSWCFTSHLVDDDFKLD